MNEFLNTSSLFLEKFKEKRDKKGIVLDSGPLTLFLSNDTSKSILDLFKRIKKEEIYAFVVAPVFTEVYKHLYILKGKGFAQSSITSILENYSIQIVAINHSIMYKAGSLKCTHPTKLSYVDCFVLALGLIYRLDVHTTEKDLPKIQNLKIITYKF